MCHLGKWFAVDIWIQENQELGYSIMYLCSWATKVVPHGKNGGKSEGAHIHLISRYSHAIKGV